MINTVDNDIKILDWGQSKMHPNARWEDEWNDQLLIGTNWGEEDRDAKRRCM